MAVFLEGMESLLPAALMVGVARSISIVLEDGASSTRSSARLVSAARRRAAAAAALLMVPFHALIHVAVPSVSGQAVLTMPLFVPMADVLGHVATGARARLPDRRRPDGVVTPTNGALMAILLAAGVPYQHWMRFASAASCSLPRWRSQPRDLP